MIAIQRHLSSGGQVLVYLNRRGYAPTLFCPACGWVAPCPRCGMNGGELVEDGTSRFRYRVKCKACGWYTEFVSLERRSAEALERGEGAS